MKKVGHSSSLLMLIISLVVLLSTSCALWQSGPQGGFSYDPSAPQANGTQQGASQNNPPALPLPGTAQSGADLERSSLEQKEKKWSTGQIELILTDVGNFIPEAVGLMQELESRRQKIATLNVTGKAAQRLEDFYRGCGKPACLEWMLFRWFARQEPLQDLEDEEEWMEQLDQKIAELVKTKIKTNAQQKPAGSEMILPPYLQMQLTMDSKAAPKDVLILNRRAASADLQGKLEAKLFAPQDYWKKTLIQRLQWGRARGLQLIEQLKQIKK